MKTKTIYDIAYEVAEEKQFDPNEAPYKFAFEVAKRACEHHVKAALQEASKTEYPFYGTMKITYCKRNETDVDTIKNSYPLTNIK